MLTMKQDFKTLSKHKTEELRSPPDFQKRQNVSNRQILCIKMTIA